MVGPILIEIVADPPPAVELRDALAASCSSVAGGGGCALGPEPAAEARARVVVAFDADYARVRVVMAPGTAGDAPAREVTFRDSDPIRERFRAAGLVVAGLVTELERAAPAPPPPPPPPAPPPPPPPPEEKPSETRRTSSVALGLQGSLAWTDPRTPWAGIALGGDIPIARSSFFVALRIEYEHTLMANPRGISYQRAAAGVGAGAIGALLDDRLELVPRLVLEAQDVGASIVEPGTGRTDAGGRFLVGAAGELDAWIPIGPIVCIALGAELDWFGGETSIEVHDKPTANVLRAWMYGARVGLNVRIP